MRQSASTTLPHALLRAYRETLYLAPDTPVGRVELRIGQPCAQLAALWAASCPGRPGGAAFVSACNPRGRPLSETQNRQRHGDLAEILRAGGWPHFEGAGIGADPEAWSPEPSWLVLAISREAARDLAERFDQNALVYQNPGGRAELICRR